jgi:hypothetical protein
MFIPYSSSSQRVTDLNTTFTANYLIFWRHAHGPAGHQKFSVLVYRFIDSFHFSTAKVQSLEPTLVSPMIHPRSFLTPYIPSPRRLLRVAGLRQSTVLYPLHLPTCFLFLSTFLSASTVSAKPRWCSYGLLTHIQQQTEVNLMFCWPCIIVT